MLSAAGAKPEPPGAATSTTVAEVGEVGDRAGRPDRGHRDHVVAACRREVGRVGGGVARRDHHGRAASDRGGVGRLFGDRAGAAAAEAEVDDFRRRGIGRNARDRAARSPRHRVDDVGLVTAALAEHAHRLHLRAEGDAGHAGVVVGRRGDRAGDVRAVPAAVLGNAEDVALAIVPVARIVRVGITAIAVDADLRIDDEVVAGDGLAVQLRMRRDAGVEHGDHHAACRC